MGHNRLIFVIKTPSLKISFKIGLILPSVILILLLTIFPTIFLFWSMFQRWILSIPNSKPVFIGLLNFYTVGTDPEFATAILNTIMFFLMTVPAEFAYGLGLALVLNEAFKGRAVFRTLFLIPMAISPEVAGLLWFFIYTPTFGLLNYFLSMVSLPQQDVLGSTKSALPALAVVDIWGWTPFAMLILLAGLQGVSPVLYEAAAVDGMSAFQRFRYVTLPSIKPAILVTLMFRSVDSLKTFDYIWVLTKGGPAAATSVLDFLVYRIGFYTSFDIGQAAVTGFVLLVLASVITYIFIRTLNIKRLLWGE